LLAGDLDYQDFKRLPRADEAVLRALLEAFISPTGRKTIAQRFYAGFPGNGGNESRQGRKR
jgi:hypothetical protein